MKKLKKIMLAAGLVSLVANTNAFAASDLLTGDLAPFWAKVIEIFGYLKTLIYVGFAFVFIGQLYDKIKEGKALERGDFEKWGWWIFLLFMLEMVGYLLSFLSGGDTGVDFGAFGG